MSDAENRRDLYDEFFKPADPPSSPGRNVLHGRVPWGKTSADSNLREVVLKEYAERYEKHGISDLISLRDHLRAVNSKLRSRARKAWDESKRMEDQITEDIGDGQARRRKPAPSAKEEDINRHKEYINKAAKLYSKAEVVQYRLDVLKKYIWENSVRGKWLHESLVSVDKKDDEERKESNLVLKRKAAICMFSEIYNPRKFASKKKIFEKIKEDNIGSSIGAIDVDPESLGRYMRENTEAGGKGIDEFADLIEEWKEAEGVQSYLAILMDDEVAE